ncbi:hypothetical protein [Agarivorans sp. QJM3NY_25]|uniref:hypothetical protein n=1 Tax=Agarivorans sp. QJM3NY_25 TaxID=3421430 RepID=UPI003D7C6DB5
MLDKLNCVISEFVEPLILKYQWTLDNEIASGMGAIKEYVGKEIYIRVVNDRGLLDIEIGSKHDKERLRCVSFFKDWKTPPWRGQSNLSVGQQCAFLNENWSQLNELLNEKNANQTIKAVDEYLQSR